MSPAGLWLCTPLVQELGKQRQVDLYESEFEASLLCRVSSRTDRITQRTPVSKNSNKYISVLGMLALRYQLNIPDVKILDIVRYKSREV